MSENETAVTVRDNQVLTAAEMRAQVNRIQEVMKAVMRKDVHYGIIPGCQKPSLYQAGAEKIAVTFRIAVRSTVEDLSTPDEAKFKTTCEAYSGDKFLGSSVGVCSSSEEKYKWRKPVCEEEFNETPEDRRRVKWAHGKTAPYQQKQIRTQPADIANTVLQMSNKRGYVKVVRQVTAASDVFTQDIQDLPPEMLSDDGPAKPDIKPPQSKSAPVADKPTGTTVEEFISDPQRKRLFAICHKQNVSQEALRDYLKNNIGTEHTAEIFRKDYDKICAWAENGGQGVVTE